MLRFILEKETWLPVAQKDGQPRDRTELSPSCLVGRGHAPRPAEGAGLGPARESKGISRTQALCKHGCPFRPTKKRGGASRPGGVSEPVWGLEDCPSPSSRGCGNASPFLTFRVAFWAARHCSGHGHTVCGMAICCYFVHKLEAASELSRFRKWLSWTLLSHHTDIGGRRPALRHRLRGEQGHRAWRQGPTEARTQWACSAPTSFSCCEPGPRQAWRHPREGTPVPQSARARSPGPAGSHLVPADKRPSHTGALTPGESAPLKEKSQLVTLPQGFVNRAVNRFLSKPVISQ